MDRGARRATVHGVARVRYDLVTKPPSHSVYSILYLRMLSKDRLWYFAMATLAKKHRYLSSKH